MSVKIRISYTNKNELQALLDKLQPDIKKYKISGEQKGDHYNAYIILKSADALKNACVDDENAV